MLFLKQAGKNVYRLQKIPEPNFINITLPIRFNFLNLITVFK